MEGLGIEHINKFMALGKTVDYRNLGESYAAEVKKIIYDNVSLDKFR